MDFITIGMDFGTTNTSIAYMKYNNIYSMYTPECFVLDRKPNIRSAITYKNKNHFWIGEEAIDNSYMFPNRYIDSLKRQIVNDTLISMEFDDKKELDIVADFFSSIFKLIEHQMPYDTAIEGIAIGIPVGFKDVHKDLYTKALVRTGIYKNYDDASKKTIFVSEPIAAVLNYNVELQDDKRVLVFDFGGGTLDLVVMDMNNIKRSNEISIHDVISKKGKLDLGGNDFDMAIFENIIVEKFGLRKLKKVLGINRLREVLHVEEGIKLMNEIRLSKEELSKYKQSTIAFEKGKLKINMEITLDEYQLAIAEYLKKIEDLVLSTIQEGGLGPNDIDLVVLSGGSSLTPAVQKLLRNIFGRDKIKVNGDAMTSIARGLALRAHYPESNKYDDILEHNYGIKMKDENNSLVLENVLKKGQKISTINDGEYHCEFEIIMEAKQKNVFRVKIFENNNEIGEAHIPICRSMVHDKFKLNFKIDENNERLELNIFDLTLEKKVEVPIEYKYIKISK